MMYGSTHDCTQCAHFGLQGLQESGACGTGADLTPGVAHVARRLCHQFPWLPGSAAALGLALHHTLILEGSAPSKTMDRTRIIQVGLALSAPGLRCVCLRKQAQAVIEGPVVRYQLRQTLAVISGEESNYRGHGRGGGGGATAQCGVIMECMFAQGSWWHGDSMHTHLQMDDTHTDIQQGAS